MATTRLSLAGLALAALAACGGSAASPLAAGYDRAELGSVHAFRDNPTSTAPVDRVVTVSARTAAGFTRRTTIAGSATTVVTEFSTAGGAESILSSRTYDGSGTMVQSLEYAPGQPFLPADLSPGAQLTASWTQIQVGLPAGTPASLPVTRTFTVDGFETVTVPAGTFRALRISSVAAGSPGAAVNWFAEGVGRVRTATWSGPLTGSPAFESVLTAFTPGY